VADTSEIQRVAEALRDAVLALLVDARGVHAETALSLLAATAGMALFRKHHPEAPAPGDAGGPVASERVGESIPDVLGTLCAVAERFGIDLPTVDGLLDLPSEHEPHAEPAALVATHGPATWGVLERTPLSPDERIFAAVIATILFLRQAAGALSPPVAAALVRGGVQAGARSAPLA
jgi:hypothetical protein